MGGSSKTSTVKYDGVIVQSSLLGITMPYGWGTSKLGCNLIDYQDFNAKQVSSGGKGGGQPQQYNYYATLVMAICVGPIYGIRTIYKDNAIFTATTGGSKEVNGNEVVYSSKTPLQAAGLSAQFLGVANQVPWSYMTSAHPANALGYPLIAYVAAENYNLDSGATPPNHNFEVQFNIRSTVNGTVIDDALLSDIMPDFVTQVPRFPSSGCLASMSTVATYVTAQGLWISPIADNGRQGSDILDEMLKASNCDAFWSDGQLNIAPYGDTTITANGVTYTPNLTPVYALTWDDIIPNSSGEDPIQWDISRTDQAYNYVQVTFNDRTLEYADNTVTAVDQANINAYGKIQANPVSLESICLASVAQTVAQLMVQRSANLRRTAEFKVFEVFGLLDPMDLITVPLRNGGTRLVRIVEANEGDDGTIDLKVEEMLVGTAHAPTYVRQSALGEPVNFDVPPGDTNAPCIINPPLALTNGNLEVWLGASGGSNWGGAFVWVSLDNVNYSQVGVINTQARYGVTTTDFPVASDPDTTQTLGLNLAVSGGVLNSGTQADANAGATMCAVGTEIISYSTATPTGTSTYNLTSYIRRGQAGTTIADQPSGSQFMRLDSSVFVIDYPAEMVGCNLYIKLQPFNVYGGGVEDLDLVTYYEFTCAQNGAAVIDVAWSSITGTGKPANNATVGAITGTNLFSVGGYGTGGSGIYADVDIYTPQGTAAAITSQGSLATNNLWVQATAPTSPLNGDLWLDESTAPYTWRVRNAGSWRSGIAVTYSNTAPSSPNNGDLWINTTTAPYTLSRYVTSSWVVVSSVGATTGQTLYSATYGVLADSQIFTSLGTAAGYTGQTSWGTYSAYTPAAVTNPPPNLLQNPTGSIGLGNWTQSGSTFTANVSGSQYGNYFQTPSTSGSNNYVGIYQIVPCTASTAYSLQGWLNASGLTGTGATARLYIEWLTSAQAHISYSSYSTLAAGTSWTNEQLQNQTSPSTAAYAKVWLDVGGTSTWSVTAGGAEWQQIKLEQGATCSIYTDDATSGALTGAVYSPSYGTQSDSSLITSLGTSSGFTGQGSLATKSSLAYGTSYLTGFGALAPLSLVSTGSSGQLNSATYGLLTDAGIYTSIGNAAGYAGQTSWGTYATYTPGQVTNPTPNLLLNPTGAIGMSQWAQYGSSFTAYNSGTQYGDYFASSSCSGSSSTNVGIYQTVGVSASTAYSLQGYVSASGVTGTGPIARLYVEWLTSALAHISYSSYGTVAGGTGFTLLTVQNQTSPSTAAYARVWCDVTGTGSWSCTASGALWQQLKLEQATASTPFTDEATNGAITGSVYSPTYGAQTDASLITQYGTASAIAGQGALATKASVAYGSSYVTGFGAMAALPYASTGSSGTLYSSTYGYLTDSGIYTSLGTAAAITGQGTGATTNVGSVATQNSLAYGGSYLTGFGALAPLNYASTGSSGTLHSSTYGYLTDSNIYTSIGTASAISGQTSWATYTGYTPAQVTAAGNNMLYNSTFRLELDGWTTTVGALYEGGLSGYSLNLPYAQCSVNSYTGSTSMPVSAGQGYSLSGLIYAAGITAGYARFYGAWYNSSGTNVGITSVMTVAAGTGWAPVSAANQIAPSTAATLRIFIDTTNAAQNANTATFSSGGICAWTQLKVELGAAVTPFNDYTTNGAVYSNGSTINALQPAQAGADVTSSHTAAAIASQSAWATYGGYSPTQTYAPGSNLLFNGSGKLKLAGISSSVGSYGWQQYGGYLGNAYFYASANVSGYLTQVSVTPAVNYSLQGYVWAGGLSAGYSRLLINWRQSSGANSAVTPYSPAGLVAAGTGWTLIEIQAQPAPSDAAYAVIYMDTTNAAQSANTATFNSGGVAAWAAIKFEQGLTCTPFSDEATNGALTSGVYSPTYGLQSDGLLITSLGTSSAIVGQAPAATDTTIQAGATQNCISFANATAGSSSVSVTSSSTWIDYLTVEMPGNHLTGGNWQISFTMADYSWGPSSGTSGNLEVQLVVRTASGGANPQVIATASLGLTGSLSQPSAVPLWNYSQFSDPTGASTGAVTIAVQLKMDPAGSYTHATVNYMNSVVPAPQLAATYFK